MEIKTKYKIGDELYGADKYHTHLPFCIKEILIDVDGLRYISTTGIESTEEQLITKNEFLDLQIKDLELQIEHFKKQKD